MTVDPSTLSEQPTLDTPDPTTRARLERYSVVPNFPQAHSPGPNHQYGGVPASTNVMEGGRSAVSPNQLVRTTEAASRSNLALQQAATSRPTYGPMVAAIPAVLPPRQGASFLQAVRDSQQNFRSDTRLKQYENPLLTVDVVVFSVNENKLKVLLAQRQSEPFRNMWSIPGGFMNVGETLDEAANRRLFDRTGVKEVYLEQLATFGEPRRDPRARVLTVSYIALVAHHRMQDDIHTSEETRWFDVGSFPPLAFDHRTIMDAAMVRLKERLEAAPIAYQLLPEKFTLTQLQRIYEVILEKKLDKRNFRKKMVSQDGLIELEGETKMEGYHRPAQLYQYVPANRAE
jgi:8-oxo-dGTP diphosphatase